MLTEDAPSFSSANAPPPTLNTVHESVSIPAASTETNFIPLGWKGRNIFGSQMISTGAAGCRVSVMAMLVMCPLPVAARLPYKVTLNEEASGCFSRNSSAALRGPIVWLLDGPVPIR